MSDQTITYKTCKYCARKLEALYLKSTSSGRKIYTDLAGKWWHGSSKCPDCVHKRYEVKKSCLHCSKEYSNLERKGSRFCSDKCRDIRKALRIS